MYSNMLVDCSNCRTPLQLPQGARSIRCALCHVVTHIAADPRSVPHQPPSTVHAPPPSSYSPSPYSHAPPGPPPSPHGRKKAVIIGISYRYSRHELKGCINDAKCMRYLLINKFNFPESSVLMLTGNTMFDASIFLIGCVVVQSRRCNFSMIFGFDLSLFFDKNYTEFASFYIFLMWNLYIGH